MRRVASDGAGRSQPGKGPARWTLPRLLAIPALLVLACGVMWRWGWQPQVVLVYGAASLASFLAYAMDKAAAVRRGWRTPERTLHLLDLLGGWPGGLLAQQWLRHKTVKPSFVMVFWLTVVLNMAGLVAWHAGGLGTLLGHRLA